MTIRDSCEHCKWLNYNWFWGSNYIYSPLTLYTDDGNRPNRIFTEIKRKNGNN